MTTRSFKNPGSDQCQRNKCFDPSLPANKTFFEVYNCNIEQPPRKDTMPAEKAIYRPDYVSLFFVHYATVTTRSQMGKPETVKLRQAYNPRYRPQKHTAFTDEETQGTMLHTKAIVEQEIQYWNRTLHLYEKNCKLGIEWPNGTDELMKDKRVMVEIGEDRYPPNCYPVKKIDEYWVPKLVEALKKRGAPKY